MEKIGTPKTGYEKGTQTHLSSEHYVLSLLYRVGADVDLTLDNKKKAGILVRNGDRIQTIDVKGVQGAPFVVGDVAGKLDDPAHYFVFVAFAQDAIGDLDHHPEVYVVPATALKPLVHPHPRNANNVFLKDLQPLSAQYRNNFAVFVNAGLSNSE
jgi:hypothetical protein